MSKNNTSTEMVGKYGRANSAEPLYKENIFIKMPIYKQSILFYTFA